MRLKIFCAFGVLIGLLGCAPAIAPSAPPPTASPRATIAMQPTIESRPTVTPTLGAPTARPQQTQSLPATSAPLTLKIISPVDESIVESADLIVSGTVTLNAVVSVNGLLAQVDPTGKFRIPLKLDEGPNLTEVVASDALGN
jgi:hypothetical protein